MKVSGRGCSRHGIEGVLNLPIVSNQPRRYAASLQVLARSQGYKLNDDPIVSFREEEEDLFAVDKASASRQQLFTSIAPVYDQMNDQLSFGLHRVWKRMAVKWSKARRGENVLDVCCGSGDLAFLLGEAVGPKGSVAAVDFSDQMLDYAASKEEECRKLLGALPSMKWVQGDALSLPFGDASFDAATMGYGLRNVTSISTALSELCRVLKKGCKVAILDFNNAGDNGIVDGVQSFFLEKIVVPEAAKRGVSEEYEYLRPSIQRFPKGRKLEQLALDAGFSEAVHHEIAFGLMMVLVATK